MNAIRAVGPEHCILSSDLGQASNPLHPDGLLAFYQYLMQQGFTEAEIDRMAKVNPLKCWAWPRTFRDEQSLLVEISEHVDGVFRENLKRFESQPSAHDIK